MKLTASFLTLLVLCSPLWVKAQQKSKPAEPVSASVEKNEQSNKAAVAPKEPATAGAGSDMFHAGSDPHDFGLAEYRLRKRRPAAPVPPLEIEPLDDSVKKNHSAPHSRRGFDWKNAVTQSLVFLGVQHGFALATQEKTRRSLRGKFFKDYGDSLRSLRGWSDGGRFFTNYIAHPMEGSFLGFIQVQNDPRARGVPFSNAHAYWKSRMKAMAWAAVWSTQFELGPISQASIGNIGLSGKQTWIDIVITPTVGTALLIGEDVVDKYLLRKIERMSPMYALTAFFRMLLNPTRSVANIVRLKYPWYRDKGLR